ncbi:class I SAM-dependent methyltransferase [Geobacter pickeringii]|uniref:Methyltransferase type 12 n=1 Tax=Geobacter pickeringii TaxID=345632 RepID=A0A0B5BE46_9BACT|nr:class I SAM-dependent methyltransferase [Geobacter pickeringii]AJE03409.1 methyltransferase type 12 [Geobacter pickeringii]
MTETHTLANLLTWYPTPSYLVKRRAILDVLARISARSVLEVGCGAGDLLRELGKRGYTGRGIDLSAEAVATARLKVNPSCFFVEQTELGEIDEQFEVVIASEVLEHCLDDVAFLLGLRERIVEGGHLLLTVPAHMAKWGDNDELCGHVRRYERDQLWQILEQAGFKPLLIYSYGVPIYNLMKPFYDHAVAGKIREEEVIEERTAKSGGMKLLPGGEILFGLLFNDFTMFLFYLLQRCFYRTDLGNGYLAVALNSATRGS